eukprot:jgi/Botrbrau1/12636/Bobra.67_1s0002.1
MSYRGYERAHAKSGDQWKQVRMIFLTAFLSALFWKEVLSARIPGALDTLQIVQRDIATAGAPGPTFAAAASPWVWESFLANYSSLSNIHPTRETGIFAPQPAKGPYSGQLTVIHRPENVGNDRSLACDSTRNTHVSQEFVKTRNGSFWFYLGDTEFHFAGTNAYYLLNKDLFSDDDVSHFFCLQGALGAKVVRFFAFLNGNGTAKAPEKHALQPEIGRLRLSTLRRLDLIVAEAAKNGIRLIMVLGNFENAYGGIQWYVDSVLGPVPNRSARDKELFYTDAAVKTAYKQYLRAIITRKNLLTGVAYRNDSAIMAWELLNEPHTSDSYERNNGSACSQLRGGCVPGRLVYHWLAEMSAFVRKLDSFHLISSGEEGYRADGAVDPPHNNWLNGGFKGVDFARNIRLPDINFATIHVYPDNWDIPANEAAWVNTNFIADRAAIAHKAGKPIIMEEFGMREGYLSNRNGTRDDLLGTLIAAARKSNFAGTLVWDFWSRKPSSGDLYSFQVGSDGTRAMVQQYQYMNLLSRKSLARTKTPLMAGNRGTRVSLQMSDRPGDLEEAGAEVRL